MSNQAKNIATALKNGSTKGFKTMGGVHITQCNEVNTLIIGGNVIGAYYPKTKASMFFKVVQNPSLNELVQDIKKSI